LVAFRYAIQGLINGVALVADFGTMA